MKALNENSTAGAVKLQSPVVSEMMSFGKSTPIIAFSHLRWDWVWQRPQQFLSRLAKQRPVLFVEIEPLADQETTPTFHLRETPGHSNVTVLQLQVSPQILNDSALLDTTRRELVQQALNKALPGKFSRAVHWYYTPMATPAFLGHLDPSLIVYDCMDQLSQFKFAPPQLLEYEKLLLKHADVVFAGGRKMWEDKKRFNSNAHFYGCGVDVNHFAQARNPETEIPEDVAGIKGPILGYFGVVDERLDYELLAKLADANPQWNIVMVGPVCKVEESELPRRANLHWLGGRDYAQLPAYTKAFDVCLMPFALNEATEFINPTKALEYMATGRPIVSSAVPDVVSNFSSVVKIAQSHQEFEALCRQILEQPDSAAIERGLDMAQNNTWDSIINNLERHLLEAATSRYSVNLNGKTNGNGAAKNGHSAEIISAVLAAQNGHRVAESSAVAG